MTFIRCSVSNTTSNFQQAENSMVPTNSEQATDALKDALEARDQLQDKQETELLLPKIDFHLRIHWTYLAVRTIQLDFQIRRDLI